MASEDNTNAERPFGSPAILGSLVASGETKSGVAEEARTRGFAAPAFAGFAFVERWWD
jgi:hypothetical protein